MEESAKPINPALARVLGETKLEASSLDLLRENFNAMFDGVEKWIEQGKTIKVTEVTQVREMALARECRLALREMRIKSDQARKKLKEDSIRTGRMIDGIHNVLRGIVEPEEGRLLELEKFAERAEKAEQDRVGAARLETLKALGVEHPDVYDALGEAPDDVWQTILDTATRADEQRKAEAKQKELVRIEAERIAHEKAEAERKEAARVEAERQAREEEQRKENAQLKAEAVAREAVLKAEKEQREVERLAADVERKKLEDAARVERETREALQKEAEAEKVARERVEKEKLAAADRALKEEAEKVAREAAQPDKLKLIGMMNAVLPALESRLDQADLSTMAAQEFRKSLVKALVDLRMRAMAKIEAL